MDVHRRALIAAPSPGLRVGLVAVSATFVLVFYAWPLATLLGRVVDVGAIGDTLGGADVGRVLWFTTWQAFVSTIVTMVVGIGPAALIARWSFPSRRALLAAVTVPFLLPTVVVAAAFSALLPARYERGLVAIVAAHAFFNVAVIVRLVGGLWAQIPSDLLAASRTLGASPVQTLRHVTLPLLRPALIAAATITFLFCFTSFGVIHLLGRPGQSTIEVEIARRATQLGDVSGAAVLSVMQLVLLVALVALAGITQRRSVVVALVSLRAPHPRTVRQRAVVAAGAVLTWIAVIVPLFALVLGSVRISGRWTLAAWARLGDPAGRPGASVPIDLAGSIGRSVGMAGVATLISLVVGTSAALAIAATRRWGRALDVGIMLPLATSAVTIGFGMLITFDRAPFDWRGSWWLVPTGHALIAIPFFVRSLVPVLRARPSGWAEAAATLGASPQRAWFEIDVRRIARPIVVAGSFAAAISLGEFGASTFLTRAGTPTLPIAIGTLLSRSGAVVRAQGFALATVLAGLTLAILLVVDLAGSERP